MLRQNLSLSAGLNFFFLKKISRQEVFFGLCLTNVSIGTICTGKEPQDRSTILVAERKIEDIGVDKTLLIVDDDEPFLRRLAKAMGKRGFEVETAGSVAAGRAISTARPPAYAVVDLRLEDGNGLDVVEVLRTKRPGCRVVVLTGYGAIATAVAAVKIGATDYLSNPADATDVMNALLAKGDDLPPPPENPMSADRVRWEHIQRVYELCDRNVSETARRLNMHRRTLQRILAKRSPK